MRTILAKSVIIALLACAPVSAVFADEFWIKAGATGDGQSKQTPSGQFSALLAQARRGDVFHVAEGEYNGREDTGEFRVDVQNLTLVGGYNADFSARHPFKHLTILRRKAGVTTDYTRTEGGILAMHPDAIGFGKTYSIAGLIVDGFVFDGETRNKYNSWKQLHPQGSWKDPLVKLVSTELGTTHNLVFRNCVFVNSYVQGLYAKWSGDKNEVSNSLFLNNMIASIDLQGAMAANPAFGLGKTHVTIKNNTIAFNWAHDKADQANGINPGRQGTYTIEGNVFAYLQRPAGAGIDAPPGTPGITMGNNLFYVTTDAGAAERVQTTAAQVGSGRRGEEEEEESPKAAAPAVAGNLSADPGFKIDLPYFDNFTSWGNKYEKINASVGNAARAAYGLKPVAAKSATPPEVTAFGRAYVISEPNFVANFVAKQPGVGIRYDGPFQSYGPRPAETMFGLKTEKASEYKEIGFEGLAAAKDGDKVKLKVGLGTRGNMQTKDYPATDYFGFPIRLPGVTQENTRDKMQAVIVRGTQAGNRFNDIAPKSTWEKGVAVRGVVKGSGMAKVLVIDFIGKPE